MYSKYYKLRGTDGYNKNVKCNVIKRNGDVCGCPVLAGTKCCKRHRPEIKLSKKQILQLEQILNKQSVNVSEKNLNYIFFALKGIKPKII
tara:strand:+ start:946 stop:1215 length:270 start_codon:yes stop_codon:yes gene_type:complete